MPTSVDYRLSVPEQNDCRKLVDSGSFLRKLGVVRRDENHSVVVRFIIDFLQLGQDGRTLLAVVRGCKRCARNQTPASSDIA